MMMCQGKSVLRLSTFCLKNYRYDRICYRKIFLKCICLSQGGGLYSYECVDTSEHIQALTLVSYLNIEHYLSACTMRFLFFSLPPSHRLSHGLRTCLQFYFILFYFFPYTLWKIISSELLCHDLFFVWIVPLLGILVVL